MKCVICRHGETKPGTATVTLDQDGLTLVVRDVPAEVCANCGEEFLDQPTTRRLFAMLEDMSNSGGVVDVRRYRAA